MADLELRNIKKSFGGVYALKGVSLECNCGEVHALLGENGAGKSTLLKVLSGAHTPDSGEIWLFGEKTEIRSPVDAIKHGIGTVYQELSTIPDLSVAENVFLGRIPKKLLGNFDYRKLYAMTQALFDKYGVTDIDPAENAGSLSLSKRQMLEILRVLSKDPKIVIFDEATSALTSDRVQWLLDLAKQLAQEEKIVLFISHRMAEIRAGCDVMTILRNGESVGFMPVQDADINEVVALMLGRSMDNYYPEINNCTQQESMLEVSGLRDEKTLNGVEFTAYCGEVLGVGGLAGQGQTELLLSLFGAHDARGTIRLRGKDVRIRSPKHALSLGIALVPEDRGTEGAIVSQSIGFNITLPSLKKLQKWLHLDNRKSAALVSKYMQELNIKATSDAMKVSELSGGNQQKVVLAKVMATEPQVLLMHDITRGVDVGTKKEMFTLVRNQAAAGKTVIYFSTDAEELTHICDRVIVMFDGKVQTVLAKDRLTRENIIAASIGEAANKG